MFGRKKYDFNDSNYDDFRREFDDVDIESESIKITANLDTRDDLYKLDDFFASDDEEYMNILSNNVDDAQGKVMSKSLKLRKDIGSDGEVIDMLEQNEIVSIIKAFNGWYYVETQDGLQGWCMCCHIDTNVDGFDRDEMAERRNSRISNILKRTNNGFINVDGEPTNIRQRKTLFGFLFNK